MSVMITKNQLIIQENYTIKKSLLKILKLSKQKKYPF